MKVYKKIMNGLAFVEKLVLVLSTILIVVLTVGNVLSRKVLHQSWSFTEELVVAVFVLITLLAAALAARDGELVNLSLLPDRLSAKARRILLVVNTAFSVAFTVVLFKYGMDKVLTQLANGKRTFRFKLAGMDFLVFRTDRRSLHDAALIEISDLIHS